jgi:plastocyanin
MQPRRWPLIAVAVCLLSSRAVAQAAATEAAAGTIIMAKDFMFAPTSLTIKAGSTVTWTNQDDEPHTVVSDSGLFRSGALDTNQSFSFRFEKAGTYRYLCSIHPRMVGTVIVQP